MDGPFDKRGGEEWHNQLPVGYRASQPALTANGVRHCLSFVHLPALPLDISVEIGQKRDIFPRRVFLTRPIHSKNGKEPVLASSLFKRYAKEQMPYTGEKCEDSDSGSLDGTGSFDLGETWNFTVTYVL